MGFFMKKGKIFGFVLFQSYFDTEYKTFVSDKLLFQYSMVLLNHLKKKNGIQFLQQHYNRSLSLISLIYLRFNILKNKKQTINSACIECWPFAWNAWALCKWWPVRQEVVRWRHYCDPRLPFPQTDGWVAESIDFCDLEEDRARRF